MAASSPRSPALHAGSQATFVAPPGWRAIDLLSDLHLGENTPNAFDAWAAHLRHTDADAVFILGDLFEVWVGDEMLGANGVIRLADPTVVVAFGERVLLSHGDALCVDDVAYQRYRAIVHRRGMQRAFAALPLAARRVIGGGLRSRSGRRGPRERRSFIDVDSAAALAWMRDAATPTLIHGHMHAPARHDLATGAVRHVLSDWELDGSGQPRAEILRWSASGFARIAPVVGAASGSPIEPALAPSGSSAPP